mgnify:CR=1 FL=1
MAAADSSDDNGNNGMEDWYKASYQINIDNWSAGGRRIKVWTEKRTWLSDNPAIWMMNKVRSALIGRAAEIGLDLETNIGEVFMQQSWPWDLLWKSFENEINKLRLHAMRDLIGRMKGHQSRTEAIKSSA